MACSQASADCGDGRVPGWPERPSTALLEAAIRAQIEQDAFNLLVTTDSGRLFLIQAERAGDFDVGGGLWPLYRQVGWLPGDLLDLVDDWGCSGEDGSGEHCTAGAASAGAPIDLWLPLDRPVEGTVCAYHDIAVHLDLTLEVDLMPGLHVAGGAGSVMEWILSVGAARQVTFDGASLDTLLHDDRPLPDAPDDEVADLNGDGQPDAWRFRFAIDLEMVGLDRLPAEDPDARPPFCP